VAADMVPRRQGERSCMLLSHPPFRILIPGRLSRPGIDDKLRTAKVVGNSPLPVVAIWSHLMPRPETAEMRGVETQNVVDIPAR
jgi:hypothetical protein